MCHVSDAVGTKTRINNKNNMVQKWKRKYTRINTLALPLRTELALVLHWHPMPPKTTSCLSFLSSFVTFTHLAINYELKSEVHLPKMVSLPEKFPHLPKMSWLWENVLFPKCNCFPKRFLLSHSVFTPWIRPPLPEMPSLLKNVLFPKKSPHFPKNGLTCLQFESQLSVLSPSMFDATWFKKSI